MISRINKILEYFLGEAGGVSFYLTNYGTNDDDDECNIYTEEEELTEDILQKKVKDGKVIYKMNDFEPEDTLDHSGRNVNLIKARLMSRTPSANIKRRHSMKVRNRRVHEETDINNVNIESVLNIPSRYYEYQLNSKTAPLVWHINTNDSSKTIRVTIDVSRGTLASKNEADNVILDTIRNNEDFRDFINDLMKDFPHNETIKTLYKLNTWNIKENENDIVYTKIIQLGA